LSRVLWPPSAKSRFRYCEGGKTPRIGPKKLNAPSPRDVLHEKKCSGLIRDREEKKNKKNDPFLERKKEGPHGPEQKKTPCRGAGSGAKKKGKPQPERLIGEGGGKNVGHSRSSAKKRADRVTMSQAKGEEGKGTDLEVPRRERKSGVLPPSSMSGGRKRRT